MNKIPFIVFLFLTLSRVCFAQDSTVIEQDQLKIFEATETANSKFKLFFKTTNHYEESSAYDWLDTVSLLMNNARTTSDTLAMQQYALIQSQIYQDLGDYSKSINIANELYTHIDDLDFSTKKILLDLMDEDYGQLRFNDKQIEIRQEKKELGITEKITFYDIYSRLGFHREALNDYILEVKKTIREDDFFGQAEYYNNVGNYLRLDNSAPTALTRYKKAKGFIDVFLNDISTTKTEKEILNGNLLKGIIEGNIGRSYLLLKQYEEAVPWLETGINNIKTYNKGKYSKEIVENTLDIADCYLQLGQYRTAKKFLSSELNIATAEDEMKHNRLLAAYYDRVGDYKNATRFHKRNIRIQDSIQANEVSLKKQQIASLVEQDLANSKKTVDEQKEVLERTRTEIQAKDEQINLVFISLIFTLLGFAGLVYAYLKSIKNQRLIAEQKHFIENSLVEKDSLLKEIHHRVKNNLQMVSSLLSLQTKNTRSKDAIDALEEGKSRVKAMALIHQKLYQNDDLSVIEMQSYIESLINSVQSVYKKGGHNINVTIDAEGTELDIDRAIPFGLILNELVSNSFKYAFPEDDENGKIYIHLRKNGELGYFEYTDNGVGLPEDTDERTNSSMGIRLMNRLVNQLQSTLNIDKTNEGVRFWFNFK